MFNHNFVTLPELEQINTDNGRFYSTPEGNRYPSVTTVIGAMSDKSGLDAWRKRVGETEAHKIMKSAGRGGTTAHKMWENLILNEEQLDFTKSMPIDLKLYKQLAPILETHVNDIMVSEGRLYSNKLKVAGSADLIANWDGKPAVIDFKTSNKTKKIEWIDGYFIQATIYAYMFWEMTGIFCPTIVVAIAVREDNEPQIFVEKSTKYLQKAKEMCDGYHRLNIAA